MRTLSVAIVAALALPAYGHFRLVSPTNVVEQDIYGDPQKDGPCGGAGTATNAVTAIQTGSTLTVTIDETIFHPGHYRVALAQTEGALPAPPPVTPSMGDQCASAAIAQPPNLPILADGQLRHTASFGGQDQTIQIPLPAGMQCTDCVLQVLQFMSSHAAPCFYYHCARVTISDTAPPPDAGPDAPEEPGKKPPADPDGCNAGGAAPWWLALPLLLVRRRRTRVSRA